MKITRRFTKADSDPFASVEYEKRTSRISNPDGSVVFEMNDAEIPKQWSQLATDIMVSKYFRKAGVPQVDTASGAPLRDAGGNVVTGPERSAKQVIHRLAGCWRYWGEKHGYFDTADDAQAFEDELSHMMLHQMCAPNSPQWFNTGLNFAYGITGPAQGHFYCDPCSGEVLKSKDAYSRPQPHACQPYDALVSTPQGPVVIGEIVEQKLIGLEVYDGSDGEGITHVIAVKANGKKQVLRVHLDNGNFIEATADHVVLAATDETPWGDWLRVDQLSKDACLFEFEYENNITVPTMCAEAALSGRHGRDAHATFGTDLLAEPTRVTRRSVARMESIGVCDVYDIQTESGQYLSNNVIVHNCFIQSVTDDLVNPGGIMDLWTREARLFKYGSGTGSNFSRLRGENEPLSGGGKSSGLMSFLRIGDRAAGAIKSGGTTRRAAKMVCLDLDHPDIENFVNWKVREELKVACLAEGIKHIPTEQRELAKKLGLKLDYDFNGEAYYTVGGQNSNNSVRIPNSFFTALEEDGDWSLTRRTDGKASNTLKARDLWDQIAYAAWRCADPGVQYDDTINQWHTCPKSGRINASNPCVTGDTRVLTPGGIWRRIDQMIHLPARVITNLDNQEIHPTEGAFPTGTREVFELTTAGGYSVKLTADHKVWTRHRGWVEAQHLMPADEIRLPARPACVQEIGEPQDGRFFQLLGLFLSDANRDAEALHLDACLSDHELAEQFAHYVQQNWGDRTYADDYVNQLMLSSSDADDADTMTATLTNRRLLSRLKAFVRADSAGGSLRLGDDAFTAGLAAQKHFLRGLFTAGAEVVDGSLMLRGQSLGLLQDVQLLLLGFGVQSFISTDGEGGAIAQERAFRSALRNGGLPGRQGNERLSSSPGARTGKGSFAPDHADAVASRHGLRIDPGSLRSFGKHIALLPGKKLEQFSSAISFALSTQSSALSPQSSNWDRIKSFTSVGKQQVFDLTEPVTASFVANGITVHNCSEYMFLDDTACNLASLNVLTFFDAESRTFDIEAYKHAIQVWTIVLEISVLMASFPSEEIARLSYTFRTLGLGYANLGAMLMQAGIPYDSPKGRGVCAALTAILTGQSYATSAEMARELGVFPGYEKNKQDMLRVIRNHRRATRVSGLGSRESSFGKIQNPKPETRSPKPEYEGLDIPPVAIDHEQFSAGDPLASRELLGAAMECWDRALELGERHGYRNAQTTVIAPTGTIGLLMDCDTTGVEPDFALVKFKKLAGGGYFKIANQSLRPALVNLGYSADEVHDTLKYVMGTLTLHDAPVINWETLLHKGFTEAELEQIEASLPGVFEISFAFSPWTLGKDFFARMDIPESEWQDPGFNTLRRLGFTRAQIDAANDVICGRGCIEGAPNLKDEHIAVFDTANKCGKYGTRFIAVEGHIRMMAAAQPFISGAISKTINLPNEATLQDIKDGYRLSWELGLKANALYRDGSKLSQPLNIKSDQDLDRKHDEEDEEAVEAAREEIASDVALAANSVLSPQSSALTSDNLSAAPTHTHVIEKIVERIVERPLRRRLPDTRHATTHKFDVAGHEGYITVGLYEDGQPGEIFIRMAKEGSTIGGLMDTIATLVSVSLQYGVPVESLVRKFEHVRFEPSGMTRNPEIPIAKSLIDYVFRWLAMEFVPGYRAANAPKRTQRSEVGGQKSESASDAAVGGGAQHRGLDSTSATEPKEGNGHSKRLDDAGPKTFDYGSGLENQLEPSPAPVSGAGDIASPSPARETDLRLVPIVADPLSQQGANLQADAPACDVCGSITVRSGTCYKCLNCGNSMGCS